MHNCVAFLFLVMKRVFSQVLIFTYLGGLLKPKLLLSMLNCYSSLSSRLVFFYCKLIIFLYKRPFPIQYIFVSNQKWKETLINILCTVILMRMALSLLEN